MGAGWPLGCGPDREHRAPARPVCMPGAGAHSWKGVFQKDPPSRHKYIHSQGRCRQCPAWWWSAPERPGRATAASDARCGGPAGWAVACGWPLVSPMPSSLSTRLTSRGRGRKGLVPRGVRPATGFTAAMFVYHLHDTPQICLDNWEGCVSSFGLPPDPVGGGGGLLASDRREPWSLSSGIPESG